MELGPETKLKISMKLYKDVKNPQQLKEKLIGGKLKCCIIKPSLIFDPFQVIVAANKAAVSDKLTTKTIYTEILFNLSITKNISRSLQTFGIDDNDNTLLVVIVNNGEHDDTEVYEQIEGTEVDLNHLDEYSDLKLIKKIYKINDEESKVTSTLDSIVSRIAVKDFISF